jgi:hypothetical protein
MNILDPEAVFRALALPFPPERVSWRVGATNGDRGMALAYIDARDVMQRLDDTVGPENWQNRYPHAGTKTVCEIGIRLNGEWVWKSDGAGDSQHEAIKGGLSDAFKRTAVRWGIGRYLYDVPSPWVAITAKGKSSSINDDQHGLLKNLLFQYARENAPPLTLEQRVDIFVTALNAVSDRALLGRAWNKGRELLAELKAENPERHRAITGLFDERSAALLPPEKSTTEEGTKTQ